MLMWWSWEKIEFYSIDLNNNIAYTHYRPWLAIAMVSAGGELKLLYLDQAIMVAL